MGKPRIIFLVALSLFNTLPAQYGSSIIISDLGASAVRVITYDENGCSLTTGCGFFVNRSGDVVTNRHVIKGSYGAEIITSDGQSYKVKGVVAEDKEGDIIKLSVDMPLQAAHVLSPSLTSPRVGDKVVVVGPAKPRGETGSDILEGCVEAVRDIDGFGTIIQITAPVSAGFSGSPVVNMSGELIGIVTFQVLREEPVNFAVPADRLTRLVYLEQKTVGEWEAERLAENESSKEELYLEGMKLVCVQDWDSAVSCFNKVIEESPIYLLAYPLIGYCSLQLERWEDAIEAYHQSLLINPDDPMAYNNIAVAYGKLDRWGEALAAYKQAVRLAPGDVHFHCGLGMAYGKLGRWGEARLSFLEAVKLDPTCGAGHYGLGLSCWVSDDMEGAWYEYRVLKGLDEELASNLLDCFNKQP